MDGIKWVLNDAGPCQSPVMSLENAGKAREFHQSFPQYSETPLWDLAGMAGFLGVGRICVKDESYRFGLNAFKVLGGSYAMARYIQSKTGASRADYDYLTGEALARDFGKATFFTATDGNHGRGVAWSAKTLGQNCVVFMPKGTSQSRFENIKKLGARVSIEDMNYDDCVRLAAKEAAQTPNGVVVQDTAWPGYEEIPAWIMQGYGTMALEADRQMGERPTHVFIQAGVGSLAGAVCGLYHNLYPQNPPKVVVVEASAADCLYRSALAGDGKPRFVTGDLQTMMAGLACGEPNTIAWEILRREASAFVSCPDGASALGMRLLAAPVKGDAPVTSGESGAVGMGLLYEIMRDPALEKLKIALGLDETSRVALFSTEGDTDPENYRKVVWGTTL